MWQRDILGDDWLNRTINVPELRGKKMVSTLVSRPQWLVSREHADRPHTAVLYIHGYNDYFFQTHVAQFFEDLGLAFFALDLHGYGRSTTDETTRNDAHSLREYGNELAAATHIIREEYGYESLLIMGHSTGGLLAALWAHSETGRATVDGLILNSPWFDLNRSWFDRTVGTAMLDAVGNYVTDYVITNDDSPYTRMLHTSYGGLWDFNMDWKRERPAPVRTGWLRAIREGQARIAYGLNLTCPILACVSERSVSPYAEPDLTRTSDTVLDVHQITARARQLGDNVEIASIPQGVHDLALSQPKPRDMYFNAIADWLSRHNLVSTQKYTAWKDQTDSVLPTT
ncbi:alpha/beta hydrolase [Timonella sp. A28]|uniref:alpha/beta hydrolase n=1 Tax=Timonella sp. A28 TaxID=3442640 RepID=UPI003EC0AA4A